MQYCVCTMKKGKSPQLDKCSICCADSVGFKQVKATAYSKLLEESIVPIMAPDHITTVVKTDPTILSVDSQMAENRGKEKQSNSRKKMRLLARVVLEMRKLTKKLYKFIYLYEPLNFNNRLQCARNLGSHNENKSFKSPSCMPHTSREGIERMPTGTETRT